MKTLNEASIQDFQNQYNQIVSKITQLESQMFLLEKEKNYFLGIIDYLKSKENLVSKESVALKLEPPVEKQEKK